MCSLNEKNAGKWLLDLPVYDGGLFSPLADVGGGLTVEDTENNSKMQVVRDTSEVEYDVYLSKLEANGFSLTASHEINGNRYAQYKKENKLVYVYYTEAFKDVRIIDDTASVSEDEFEYKYIPKEGETAAVYQYGLMHDVGGNASGKFSGGKYTCGGNFYIIRLSDNRLIIFDGGADSQVTPATFSGLVHFLHEITGTQEHEKIKVACFFVSHAHGDHYAFFDRLVREYSDHVEVERVMYNIPKEGVPFSPAYPMFVRLGKMIEEKYPSVKFMKPHTGQDIQIGDARLEILFTHEDMITAETGEQFITEYNSVSTIIRMTINGTVFMWLGDWGGGGYVESEYKGITDRLFRSFEKDGEHPYLKSDFVQVAHHAVNTWMDDTFEVIGARVALVPNSHRDCVKLAKWYDKVFKGIIMAGAKEMYFAGEKTHGFILYQDGTMEHHAHPIEGVDEGYLEMYEAVRKL